MAVLLSSKLREMKTALGSFGESNAYALIPTSAIAWQSVSLLAVASQKRLLRFAATLVEQMSQMYYSKTRVGPGGSGWLVAWMSNQLTQVLPQWPWLRVLEGQELWIAIDPRGGWIAIDSRRGRSGVKCDSKAEDIRVSAVIAPDQQPPDKRSEYLLPFPPFHC